MSSPKVRARFLPSFCGLPSFTPPRIANLQTSSAHHCDTSGSHHDALSTLHRSAHAGSVKQIVGGTLSTTAPDVLKTNWTSEHPSAYYADLYRQHDLTGAHVIMLGPGNEQAAQEALNAWPSGMQVGGGITDRNAAEWIAKGAERVSSRHIGQQKHVG